MTPGLETHWHYVFKIIPMFAATFFVWLGYDLFIKGVTGAASLYVAAEGETLDIEAQLVNAAPGLFFAVGGITIVCISVIKGAFFSRSSEVTAPEPMPLDDTAPSGSIGGGSGLEIGGKFSQTFYDK